MPGATVAEEAVLRRNGASVEKSEDSTRIDLGGWQVCSRARPILSDQEREALTQRIAHFWSVHFTDAASMMMASHDTRNYSEVGAGCPSTTGQSTRSGIGEEGASASGDHPADLSNAGHNFIPLPEILFGKSFLELRHSVIPGRSEEEVLGDSKEEMRSGALPATTDFWLRFNTTGALISWAERHVDTNEKGKVEVVRVPEASRWAAGHLGAGLRQVRYDWVFGTDYEGELLRRVRGGGQRDKVEADPCDTLLDVEERKERSAGLEWEVADASVIDRSLLQCRDQPILFYDDVTLYEDELHDHGVVSLNVKVRVMPTCWFVLLRYFLRVDGVLLRIRDTRYFHRMGHEWIGKESRRKEVTFAQLAEEGLSTRTSEYRDVNAVVGMIDSIGPPADVCYTRLVLHGAPS